MAGLWRWLVEHDESIALLAGVLVLAWTARTVLILRPVVKWFDPHSDVSDANDGTIPGRVHDLERRVAKLERDPE